MIERVVKNVLQNFENFSLNDDLQSDRQIVVNINQINKLNNLQYTTRKSFVFYDISIHVVLFNVEIQLEFVGLFWLSLSVSICRV